MRILHLMQSAPRIYGAERCILLEIAALRRRGHDTQAVVVRETRQGPEGAFFSDTLRAAGVAVTEVLADGPFSPGLLLRLGTALRRERGDRGETVVHSHGMKTDILAALVAPLVRLPLVVEVHGWLRPEDDRRVRVYEALDKACLRFVSGTIALSRAYEAELRAAGARRVYLLPSGIDVEELAARPRRRDLRAELGLPPDALTVGIVARLSPEKGHEDFLFALREARAARAEQAPLIGLIIGEGPRRGEIEEEARRLGLSSDALRFTGYVDDVADAYRALDVLVSCSRFEGLPLNLIEAMALERTILSYDTGGCADLLAGQAPEEPGVLVPRGQRQALAAGLVRLCADAALRRRLGAAAGRRALSRYSLGAWADGAEAVYRDVLRRAA